MSEQTLNFGEIVVDKRLFHSCKQAITLYSLEITKILVSNKYRHSEDSSKHYIGYLHDDDIVRPLCIILIQMSGYLKYFNDNKKKTSHF